MTPSIWALRKKKAFLKKRVSVHKSGYKTYFANSVLEKNERSQMTAWCSDPKKPKYFFFFFFTEVSNNRGYQKWRQMTGYSTLSLHKGIYVQKWLYVNGY